MNKKSSNIITIIFYFTITACSISGIGETMNIAPSIETPHPQQIEDNDWNFIISYPEKTSKEITTDIGEIAPDEGNVFYKIKIEIQNKSENDRYLTFDFSLYDMTNKIKWSPIAYEYKTHITYIENGKTPIIKVKLNAIEIITLFYNTPDDEKIIWNFGIGNSIGNFPNIEW